MALQGAISGVSGVDGVEKLAQSYGTGRDCSDDDVVRPINWQVTKAGMAGFVTVSAGY